LSRSTNCLGGGHMGMSVGVDSECRGGIVDLNLAVCWEFHLESAGKNEHYVELGNDIVVCSAQHVCG
jgi:hypothetical protein